MNPKLEAIFIHDTRRIIHASADAHVLFRCEEWELIDRDMLDLVPEYLRDLTRFNLYSTLRGKGSVVKTRHYDFVRCDGTIFAASVNSRLLDDGTLETTVTYRYEVTRP